MEFEELLPEVIGQQPEETVQVAITAGRPLELVSQNKSSGLTKRRIKDLATWLEAWTTYVIVVVQASPERASELLAYQATNR